LCLTGKRKYTGENDERSDSHGIVGLFNKRGADLDHRRKHAETT
jgi:hypothetical protein